MHALGNMEFERVFREVNEAVDGVWQAGVDEFFEGRDFASPLHVEGRGEWKAAEDAASDFGLLDRWVYEIKDEEAGMDLFVHSGLAEEGVFFWDLEWELDVWRGNVEHLVGVAKGNGGVLVAHERKPPRVFGDP